MRRVLTIAAALLLAASSCRSTAPACDPPHSWSVRSDSNHEPHDFFWCTCGQHEPRTAVEAADAASWYARGGR